jgi:hypothetical protein
MVRIGRRNRSAEANRRDLLAAVLDHLLTHPIRVHHVVTHQAPPAPAEQPSDDRLLRITLSWSSQVLARFTTDPAELYAGTERSWQIEAGNAAAPFDLTLQLVPEVTR